MGPEHELIVAAIRKVKIVDPNQPIVVKTTVRLIPCSFPRHWSDINILERANERDDKSIDIMYRDLKEKKDSLRKIELDIRDLDKVLS